eukprot:14922133-Ditylum_brightwellii.AAC.1
MEEAAKCVVLQTSIRCLSVSQIQAVGLSATYMIYNSLLGGATSMSVQRPVVSMKKGVLQGLNNAQQPLAP